MRSSLIRCLDIGIRLSGTAAPAVHERPFCIFVDGHIVSSDSHELGSAEGGSDPTPPPAGSSLSVEPTSTGCFRPELRTGRDETRTFDTVIPPGCVAIVRSRGRLRKRSGIAGSVSQWKASAKV